MPERPERLVAEPSTGPKVSKKTTILVVGSVVAIGGLFYLIRKKKQAEEPAVATEAGALTSQAFIPVTGENVAGMGSGGGGLSTGGNQEANSALLEYIKLNNERTEHHEDVEKQFLTELIGKLGTGGGPPSYGENPTPVPPPPAPHPPTPAPPNKPVSCPSSHPHYNPAKGPVGPSSCYKIGKCNNKSRPVAHEYQRGSTECVP